MLKVKKRISPEHAQKKYESITKRTYLWIALISLIIFAILICYSLYKNYSIYTEFKSLYESNIRDLFLYLPYNELLYSFVLSVCFFAVVSFAALLYKRYLKKKLPVDYFYNKQIEEEKEKESNKRIMERINTLSVRKKNKFIFVCIGLLVGIIIYFFLFLLYILGEQNFSYTEIGVGISISIMIGAITGFLLYYKNSSDLENLQWQVNIKTIETRINNSDTDIKEQTGNGNTNDASQAVKPEESFLSNYYQANFKYLIVYNELTKKQADKSFLLALLSSVLGTLLITFGIVLMFFNATNPTYIATAGGVITELISVVFLYFHTKTLKNMSRFHNKLLLSQNTSIALKIVEELPNEEKNTTRAKIAEQLVSDINKYISHEKG